MKVMQALETAGPGGAEQNLVDLCRELQARGHRVRALLIKQGWTKEQLEKQGTEVAMLPLLTRAADPKFLSAVRGAIADFEPDVFQSHEITFGLYGRMATRSKPLAHVATAHGKNFSRGLKRRVLGAVLFRKTSRFRLVAVSDSLAGHLSKQMLLTRRAIQTIPNGVEVPESVSGRTRSADEPLRLVAVGNLYPVKNHALLIRAVGRLKQRGVHADLEILGRGKEEADLKALVEGLGIDDRVHLRGFRSDVDRFLASSHIFASSSLSEGMPISFLEAMALGLPVVASRVGGVPEIVEHEKHGLLFPSENLDRLVEALLRARDEFSVDRMVRTYSRLYEELGAK